MRRMIVLLLVALVYMGNAFRASIPYTRKVGAKPLTMSASEEDPNYKAHLPSLLKKGMSPDRPDPEIAVQLRARYKEIIGVKKDAASTLKTANPELAAELEELADEMEETHEHFVALAESWDAWGRPDPDLASQLREKKYPATDPNYEAHIDDFMKKGQKEDRPGPDLPSELRMLKYKNMAGVKKLAAGEIKRTGLNEALAEELSDIAEEIEESHERFENLVMAMKERAMYQDTSKSTR
jgi:acyl carrier protein phosphodiesterase